MFMFALEQKPILIPFYPLSAHLVTFDRPTKWHQTKFTSVPNTDSNYFKQSFNDFNDVTSNSRAIWFQVIDYGKKVET